MEKPILDPLPTWFQSAWLQLRSALFIGTVIVGMLLSGAKAYREVFPQQEPATAAELHQANADMQQQFRAIADSVVRGALSAYNDSLNMVRVQLEDSVARPVYKAILDLDRRLSRLERGQAQTGVAIEEQKEASKAAMATLMKQLNEQNKDERVLAVLDAVMDRMDEIEKHVTKSKTTKGKF